MRVPTTSLLLLRPLCVSAGATFDGENSPVRKGLGREGKPGLRRFRNSQAERDREASCMHPTSQYTPRGKEVLWLPWLTWVTCGESVLRHVGPTG